MKRFFIIYLIVMLVSCDLINPSEDTPSFVRIENIEVETRQPGDPDFSGNEGTASAEIRDAWVFIDENLDGVYELPAIIPVKSGNHDIRVIAGIFNNSRSNDRAIYPFYENYTGSYSLDEEETLDLNPTVNYVNTGINFWHEDFEDAFIKLEERPLSEASISSLNDPDQVFEGNGCGSINLTDNDDFFQAQTVADIDIAFNKNLYLELNYKCNNRFTVGMRNDNIAVNQIPYVGFNPSLDENDSLIWKKAYVFFTPILNQLGEQGDFEVFFEAEKETENPLILLDNLKIVFVD